MTLAGPAAAITALLPTNSPAPITPPIAIIDRCRDSSERLNERCGVWGVMESTIGVHNPGSRLFGYS